MIRTGDIALSEAAGRSERTKSGQNQAGRPRHSHMPLFNYGFELLLSLIKHLFNEFINFPIY